MKRLAFLIGGTYRTSDNDLPGVVADIRAWKKFLSSSFGGSWTDDEIIDLSGKDKAAISVELGRGAGVDYSLVCFSGHGCLVKDRFGFSVTKVLITDRDEMLEYELNPESPWCTMVFDCCRKLPTEEKVAFANETITTPWIDDTRTRFEEELRKCERGLVKVFAADVGEAAADNRSFSRVLISVAQNLDNYSDGVLRINKAVQLAGEAMPKQQNPVYEGGRRLRHFPFAVLPKSNRL
jgi:hypothetical protein